MDQLRFALFLTLIRLVISPIFVVLYLYNGEIGISSLMLPYYLLGLLVLCELSDVFDGVVARRMDQVTDLGKLLDPMADSIVRISFLFTFTRGIVQLPLLLVLVFVYRDMFISTLRTLCALRGKALAARTSGKLKAIIQAVTIFAIVILMIPLGQGLISLEFFQSLSFYIASFAAVYTVASGVEYLVTNRGFIRDAWSS